MSSSGVPSGTSTLRIMSFVPSILASETTESPKGFGRLGARVAKRPGVGFREGRCLQIQSPGAMKMVQQIYVCKTRNILRFLFEFFEYFNRSFRPLGCDRLNRHFFNGIKVRIYDSD